MEYKKRKEATKRVITDMVDNYNSNHKEELDYNLEFGYEDSPEDWFKILLTRQKYEWSEDLVETIVIDCCEFAVSKYNKKEMENATCFKELVEIDFSVCSVEYHIMKLLVMPIFELLYRLEESCELED